MSKKVFTTEGSTIGANTHVTVGSEDADEALCNATTYLASTTLDAPRLGSPIFVESECLCLSKLNDPEFF